MEDTGTTYTLLNMFYDGGLFMYPLVLCSLFAMGVILAKLYTLYIARRRSRSILVDVEQLIKAGKIDEAVRVAEETPGPVAAILLAGLRRVREAHYSSGDIEKAIKTTGTIELGFIERGLPILATISNVAPLLGFLGTVAGMIIAFGRIAEAGQVEASLVAGGIKIALITTATGLIIAVPVNIAYNYFVTRIDKLIIEMEEGTSKILNLIWDMGDRTPMLATAGGPDLGGPPASPIQPLDPGLEGTGAPDPGSRKKR